MINLYKDISPGDNLPKEINVIIDIPKGCSNKYEYQEKEGYFELNRVLYSPIFFPFEYGFIPQTSSEDGDALDVVLLSTYPAFSGCLIKARPIGVLLMEDEAGIDHKIIAVPQEKVDPRFKEIQDIQDLPEHFKKEIQVFFEDMKKLEPGKFVKLKGWQGKDRAEELIKEAIKRYESEGE